MARAVIFTSNLRIVCNSFVSAFIKQKIIQFDQIATPQILHQPKPLYCSEKKNATLTQEARIIDEMRSTIRIVTIVLPIIWAGGQARTFYIDSRIPIDTLNGLSPQQAWKNTQQLKRIKIRAGDSILFRNGGEWTGERFEIHQGGTPKEPIFIGTYGPSTLPKPHLIDTSAQVVGIGANHIVVSGLKLSGARRYGISTLGRNRRGIELTENEIHDCTNGIIVNQSNQVAITNNHIHNLSYNRSNNGAIGITIDQSRNTIIKGNRIKNCIGINGGKHDGGAIELFRSCNNITITENRAINTWGFIEMGGFSGDTIRNINISRNTAINTRTFTWFNLDTPEDTTNFWGVGYDSIQLTNNTLIQNRPHTSNAVGASGNLTNPNQIIIENNIFSGDSLNNFVYKGNFRLRNNIFWSRISRTKYKHSQTNEYINPQISLDTNKLTYFTRLSPFNTNIGSPQSKPRN